MSEVINKIYEGVLEGDARTVSDLVQMALIDGLPAEEILSKGLILAMGEVGKRFEEGEYFVPEMLISARAMQSGLALLKPQLQQSNIQAVGKVLIGTVKGDLHDIGKNLVSMMLEGAGFEIKDIGTDVSPERFVAEVQSGGYDILALSALLTTTMPNMKSTVEAFKTAGLRDQVKIIVGGAPVTEDYARQIGADGYASDASRAVSLAKSLVA